jgi:ribosomal protein S6
MTRIQLHADPKVVHELDQVFRHAESVIKYMTALMSERLLNQKPVEESTSSSDDHGDGDNGRRRRRE